MAPRRPIDQSPATFQIAVEAAEIVLVGPRRVAGESSSCAPFRSQRIDLENVEPRNALGCQFARGIVGFGGRRRACGACSHRLAKPIIR